MDPEELDNNPIFQLGVGVLAQERSLEESINEAASVEFLERVDEDDCRKIVSFMDAIVAQDPASALVFSLLNLRCAETKNVEPNLWAFVKYVHGTVLMHSGLMEEAIKYFDVARKYFDDMDMGTDVAGCDTNIARVYWQLGYHDRQVFSPHSQL